jgi:phosphoserine phosphatase
MATDGLRMLAFAHRAVPDACTREQYETDLIFDGLVGLADPPRPEVPSAIRTCRAAGIRVVMITGDHPETARAIAHQIGLVERADPVVIIGTQLRQMSDTQLQFALDAPEVIFARIGADQKMRVVTTLRRKNHVVAVTGDGVNDAPALRAADIGIAMGERWPRPRGCSEFRKRCVPGFSWGWLTKACFARRPRVVTCFVVTIDETSRRRHHLPPTYDEEREELIAGGGDSDQRNWHLVSLVSSVCSAARSSSCDSLPPRNASLLSLQTAVGSSYSAQIIFIVRSSRSVTRVTVDPITGQ